MHTLHSPGPRIPSTHDLKTIIISIIHTALIVEVIPLTLLDLKDLRICEGKAVWEFYCFAY